MVCDKKSVSVIGYVSSILWYIPNQKQKILGSMICINKETKE